MGLSAHRPLNGLQAATLSTPALGAEQVDEHRKPVAALINRGFWREGLVLLDGAQEICGT